MSTLSSIAVYFIIWWLCLFLVLPFGVRNAHEAGEKVDEGNDAGAPVKPMLWRKVLINTVLSGVVFVVVYGIITWGWIRFEDIPFIGKLPGV